MNKFLATTLLLLALLVAVNARAQDAGAALPAKPTRFFNDYALATRPDTQETLNRQLADFERQTSNQILVAIFPKLPDGAEAADYGQKVFRAWQPGQAGQDNGAILFVFLKEHRLRIQTGRGLEGALPDATCRRIIADDMAPRFKANDADGALTAGVNAMLGAARGEYQGTGKTVSERQGGRQASGGSSAFNGLLCPLFIALFFVYLITSAFRRSQRGVVYGGRGYGGAGGGGPVIFGGGFGSGGGGGGFGGGGGGSDDSFSSGGGDSGGGGASGDW